MLNEIVNVLKDKKVKMKPMNKMEVKKLEGHYNLQFPSVYKEFLLTMGKGAGDFMRGSSVFFDEIYDLSEYAKDLISENNLKQLPDNAFVFWMHQGYQMAYFLSDGDENPEVYFFSESFDKNVFVVKDRLSDFFKKQMTLANLGSGSN